MLDCTVNTEKFTSVVTDKPVVIFVIVIFMPRSPEDWVMKLTLTKLHKWSVGDFILFVGIYLLPADQYAPNTFRKYS